MKVSVIVPVGNMDEWSVCEASLKASVAAYSGAMEAELLPCFDLEHRGAYVARNEGLAKARGEWIAWVDCDDVVEREWFAEIAEAIEAHPEADVIQYDAIEVKDGKERPLAYGKVGEVSGEEFARELLRNDGMPAWLWTRTFRREVMAGAEFRGRVKQDYQMFLQILTRVRSVWSVGKPLYRYIRHGHGLSNYVQSMDYAEAGREFERMIVELPERWRRDAQIGLALTMADVVRHSAGENGSRQWVRKYLGAVLCDMKVPWRLKAKAVLAAMGV